MMVCSLGISRDTICRGLDKEESTGIFQTKNIFWLNSTQCRGYSQQSHIMIWRCGIIFLYKALNTISMTVGLKSAYIVFLFFSFWTRLATQSFRTRPAANTTSVLRDGVMDAEVAMAHVLIQEKETAIVTKLLNQRLVCIYILHSLSFLSLQIFHFQRIFNWYWRKGEFTHYCLWVLIQTVYL